MNACIYLRDSVVNHRENPGVHAGRNWVRHQRHLACPLSPPKLAKRLQHLIDTPDG